jgi:predicted nucleotidyltransferase
LIQDNLEAIKAILKAHKVISAGLFGSALGPNFNERSDVDFLIEFAEDIPILDYADNYFDLKASLEDLLERNVDLVSLKSLKNPVLIAEINHSKVELYSA